MKRMFGLVAMMAAVLLIAGFYVIPVYPPGVGTRITSLPYIITQPGFYYLGGNLSGSGGGITVSANNVTIDLMGFRITGGPTHIGILLSGGATGVQNVEIRNGTIKGFNRGIEGYFAETRNARIINVRAIGNSNDGIYFSGSAHMIKGCTLSDNGRYGLWCRSSLVIHNVAIGNSTKNLDATGTVVDNYAP